MYKEIANQYQRYMGHVLKHVGGTYTTPKTVEQAGPIYVIVPKEKQKRAVAFLQEQLFTTPYWLMDSKLYDLTTTDFSLIAKIQKSVLMALLSPPRLTTLVDQEKNYGTKAYTVTEMLHDLKQGIFSELATQKPISIYRRDLQKTYVELLISIISKQTTGLDNDGLSVVKGHAKLLAAQIKTASAHAVNTASREHLVDMSERLNHALKPKADIN
jgi:hypothetical protein